MTNTLKAPVPGASIEDVAREITLAYEDIDLTRHAPAGNNKLMSRAERIRRVNTQYRMAPDMARLAARQKFVAGRGNIFADVMFVGDMPSLFESQTGRALDGKRREILLKLLFGIDCKEDQIYTTYLLKYRTPANRTPNRIEIAGIVHLIRKEIDAIKPKVVVAWGRSTINALIPGTSLYETHGMPLKMGGTIVVPMFSPDAVMMNPEAARDVQRDFQTIHKLL